MGPAPAAAGRRPNILVIVVDQLRFPQWFGPIPASRPGLPPNLERLRPGAVSFASHYTASNDCTPARSTLLTGLYTHQTGCMITGGSTLDPGFPTWGTMLREHGYQHLLVRQVAPHPPRQQVDASSGRGRARALRLRGRHLPLARRRARPGLAVDPQIADQFAEWFAARGRRRALVHDRLVRQPARHRLVVRVERPRPGRGAGARRDRAALPPNFETPELLIERNKPRLQRSLQDTAAASFGPVPFTGPEVAEAWLPFLDLYVKLQREVDRHIGRVLRRARKPPARWRRTR